MFQITELDRNLEQTRQELNRTRANTGQLEEQWHAREQDLLVHLEDSRAKEKRLEDQKHNLEVCLVDATQQIQELKVDIFTSFSSMLKLHFRPNWEGLKEKFVLSKLNWPNWKEINERLNKSFSASFRL